MSKTTRHTLVWSAEHDSYELFTQNHQDHPLLQGDDPAWFAWLASHTSFSFRGKHGALSFQKEMRPRGSTGYWYAYRRQGKRMVKHYVGHSTRLTMDRAEAAAQALGAQTCQTHSSPEERSREPGVPGSHAVEATSEVRSVPQGVASPESRAPLPQVTLLVPKLHPPRLSSTLIAREHLLARLDSGLSRKLTLLSAPAGFGKSTLVQQWLDDRKARGQFPPVAWVSLDAGDNDPVRFWRYVLTACQAFGGGLGSSALAQLSARQAPLTSSFLKTLLTTFLNDAVQLAERCVLVLEDYHVVGTAQIHETLTFLLDHQPTTLHLVLIARNEPALPLARWRAKDDLLELHASDLSFSSQETRAFLHQALPFPLSAEAITRLQTHVEGWVTGLRLLTLALQGRSNEQESEHVLTSFTGSHRYLLDYFAIEVLDAQSEMLQAFLLQTSVLSRLTGPLCDAVAERGDSDQLLEVVERAGLFLQPIEGAEPWYRYHALFAEAMRAEAYRRLGQDVLRSCLCRASAWYEQQGILSEAIEASLQAEDYTHAVALIEQLIGLQHYTEGQSLYTVQRWLKQLPETVLYSSPALCFFSATALTFVSASDQLAPATLVQVEAFLQRAEQAWCEENNTSRLGEVFAFRALLAVRQGEVKEAAPFARQALAWLPEEQVLWRGVCLGVRGEEERWMGQFDAARQTLLAVLPLFDAINNHPGKLVTALLLGEVCSESGALHQAAELYQKALTWAGEAGENLADRAKALVGLAWLSYEWNNLERAEQLAREALDLSTPISDEPLQIKAQLVLARALHARGETGQALHTLQALPATLSPARSPLLIREILSLSARLELAAGNLSAAQRWATTRLQHREELPRLHEEQEELLLARMLLAQGATHAALDVLKRWQTDAKAGGRARSALEIQVLLGLAYHLLKQEQLAREVLREAVSLAHAEGYLRLFLDEGEPMETFLRILVSRVREKPLLTYLQSIVSAFERERAGQRQLVLSDHAPLIEDLSPQERQVLRLLVAGCSRQEIAETLVITINTVKTHLQRIYQKLQVTSRYEACEMARRLHLQ